MGCIKNSLKYDIDKKSERVHLLTGLKKILMDIDKAISIIRHTEQECDVVPNLMLGFSIDEVQAEYIAEIKLRNLNKEYILKRTDEIEKLIADIDEMQSILENDKKVHKLIRKQLEEISKKYGTDRKTELISDDEIEVYQEELHIDDYALTIFVTRENYIKKVSALSLRATTAEHKLKENDEIMQAIETTNKSEILLFSNKCVVYKLRTHELADTKVSNMGEYLPSILGLDDDERIIYTVVTTDYSGMMLFGFENGKMAKIELSNYATKTNRKKLIGAYSDKSPLSAIRFITEDIKIVVYSDSGKALVVETEKIPLKATKNTQGVQVMKLKKGTVMNRALLTEESGIEDLAYYSTKNIPATGCFLKKDDGTEKQLTLF